MPGLFVQQRGLCGTPAFLFLGRMEFGEVQMGGASMGSTQ